MDWDIKKLVNDPDWQGLPYEERYKAMQEVDPDFADLPASERAKGIAELRGTDLKATHAANVAAGEAAYKPGWIEAYQTGAATGGGPGGLVSVAQQMGKDVGAAIKETPQRIGGMIAGIPELAKAVVLPPALGGGVPPVLKTMIEKTTEPLISPRTTGKALIEAGIDTALTAGLAKGGGALATKVAPAASRRIMQSIIKPVKGELQFSKNPIGAVLDEKLGGNSLPNFAENVSARKGELLNKVEQQIANSTETIPRSDVLGLLDKEAARLNNSIGVPNKKNLLERISTMQDEIAGKYSEELSLQEAHQLRREIDDSIPKFTSEAVEQEANKAKYALRTGINDLMEAKSPGIKAANRRVSELIDVERALDRRILQAQNAALLPSGHILGEVAGAALGAPGYYTGARLAGKAISSPAVLTRAANVLNTFAPKRGLAGAIGGIGAAPAVAPRQPGLAGALARTKPAEPFKGDIKSPVPPPVPQSAPPSLSQAVTQGAATSGSASTVRSPQPAGGLQGAIEQMKGGGGRPFFTDSAGNPISIEQLESPEFIESLPKWEELSAAERQALLRSHLR